MRSNRNQGRELIGQRVRIKDDGRKGTVTNGGYDRVSVDLDEGHWIACPVRDVQPVREG